MSNLSHHINEARVAEAFTLQSEVFDQEFSQNPVIIYKRSRVREHVLKYLNPCSSILELNSGTGEDAIFFAKSGHKIHATDVSEGMQKALIEKVKAHGLESRISYENCSYHHLHLLENQGPFDLIFSNFGGLNCTGELDKVLASFSTLVKPGGYVCLVIIPPFCLWEALLIFNGEFRLATRRFFSRKGAKARVEGHRFTCWYYSPSYVNSQLKNDFVLTGLEGLCTILPPSYKDQFLRKHPILFEFLKRKEDQLKEAWPWRNWGDYFIASFRRKD